MICPSCRSKNDDAASTCFQCGAALMVTIRKGSVVANRYEVLETLGKGGMGMVYKAHDRVLDETVALKTLRSDVASEPDMERRFRSEIKLARKVRHRNVCGIHEYGEDGGIRYIAMEYIEGVDLRHVLERKGAPLPEEAFEIAIQVAEGLTAIHDVGIVHRDLKTPNIMRDARGHVRLMDFGIAKQLGEATLSGATAVGMIVGTPEYMSPEQARGEKIDFRSDVYALGIVIFEIFTGSVPFRGETPIVTLFKQIQDAPPLDRGDLPPALVPVLEKCLAKKADDRYPGVHDLVDALKDARKVTFPQHRSGGAVRGATALQPDASARPSPTIVPTPVPTAVPTQMRPAAAATEVRSAEALEREKKERERVIALKQAADRVETALGRNLVDEAAQALAEARQAFGDIDPLPALARKVEDARHAEEMRRADTARRQAIEVERQHKEAEEAARRREAEEREAAVQALLAQARDLAARKEYPEADAAIQQALQHDPRHAEAQALLETTRDQWRAHALTAAAASIDGLIASGQFTEAQNELREAERTYGAGDPTVKALKKALQEGQKQTEARQRAEQAEARKQEEARKKAETETRRKVEQEERAAAEARRRAEQEARRQETLRGAEAVTMRGAPATRPAPGEAPAIAPTPAYAPAAHVPPPPQPSGGGGMKLAAIGGVGVLVLGGIIAVAVSRRGKEPEPVPSTPSVSQAAAPTTLAPLPSAPPAAPGLGSVVVDAVPWGEVVDITDASGNKQDVPLNAYTPIVLNLPPGSYTISLRNPAAARPVQLKVTVATAGVERPAAAEFRRVDASEYLKRAGL